MAGYVKKIALIKGVKSGFSADGGSLSGLVKCQSYAGFLKVEASLINFAPLSEGRYLFGISDGENVITFDNEVFEVETRFNLSAGFSFLVVFCHNNILPIAEACCSRANYCKIIYDTICAAECKERQEINRKTTQDKKISGSSAVDKNGATVDKNVAAGSKNEVTNGDKKCDVKGVVQDTKNADSENINADGGQYNDEAIAEADYYEYEDNEGDGTLREAEKEEENGRDLQKNEDDSGTFKEGENRVNGSCLDGKSNGLSGDKANTFDGKGNGLDGENGENCEGKEEINFYESKRKEIENIFLAYPEIDDLAKAIEGSRWAKINYGESDYYAFGEVYVRGKIEYLCYAVPINGQKKYPEGLKEKTSLINADGVLYRVIYQSAHTGELVKR